uniref:hypothetical protein n=1 Tax=Salmonella sp. SAL4360 TaxID=3159881 RepID=UPI00397846FF
FPHRPRLSGARKEKDRIAGKASSIDVLGSTDACKRARSLVTPVPSAGRVGSAEAALAWSAAADPDAAARMIAKQQRKAK